MRQRDPELTGAEPLADLRVLLEGLVAEEPHVRALVGRIEVHAVAALLLVLQEHRQLADVDVPGLRVVLARDGAQVDDFEVLAERHPDPIDVGELVAVGVDPHAVGVPLEHPGRGGQRRGSLPGGHHRQVHVPAGVVAVLEHRDPAVELELGDLLGQLLRGDVLRVELLQVVRGGEAAQRVAPEARVVPDPPYGGQHHREGIVRLRRDEPDRARVDLLDGDRLAVDGHHGQGYRHQLLVQVDVLVPEDEVVGGERLPVAPPHPAAQQHGGDLTVRAHLPAPRDVGDHLGAGVVVVEELVVLGHPVPVRGVEGPSEAAPPRATVLPDLAQRLDHERVLADPFLDRRELAGLHQLRERGGLLEALREQRGVGDDLRPFELADEVGARLRGLRGGAGPEHGGPWVAAAAVKRPRRSRARRDRLRVSSVGTCSTPSWSIMTSSPLRARGCRHRSQPGEPGRMLARPGGHALPDRARRSRPYVPPR